MKNIKNYLIIFVISILFVVICVSKIKADNNLSGRIVIQTEMNGEAWYINPENNERYYLGSPVDAFIIMKKLGIGITDKDLEKISFEFFNISGDDTDLDGLSDMFEDAIKTDKNNKDTDNDGYSDFEEIFYNFNPNGNDKIKINKKFVNQHGGKIFLQVENNGEAWYINPVDNKRYFLGRPFDAFSIMKSLGLGITNSDLEKIKINTDFNNGPIYKNKEEELKEEPKLYPKPEPEIKPELEEEFEQDGLITNCKNSECIDEKYKTCDKATLTLNIGNFFDYYIEILGYKNDLCEIKARINNPPVEEWNNKEMVCLLSENQDLNAIIDGSGNCSGELYDILYEQN